MKINFRALNWLLLIASHFVFSASYADEYAQLAKQNNSYIALSAGKSRMSNACTSPWVWTTSSCSESARYLGRIAYGYYFSPSWGIEASIGDFGFASSKGDYTVSPVPTITAPLTDNWEMNVSGLSIAGIGRIYLSNTFALFGKLGVLGAKFEEKKEVAGANGPFVGTTYNGVPIISRSLYRVTGGLGMQYDLSKNVSWRLQAEYFGKYDVYGPYGVATTAPITIMMLTTGVVLGF